MINTKEIIQWSKYNIPYLKLTSHKEWLKKAQPNESILHIGLRTFDTAEFANFLGELLEKFNDACTQLDIIESLLPTYE